MADKKYKLSIVIGRFEPLHNEHIKLIQYAKDIAEVAVVIIGSSFQEPSRKNPFSEIERKLMIENSLNTENLIIEFASDFLNDDIAWKKQIYDIIHKYVVDDNMVLIGHNKDTSSYYLDLFDCDFIDVGITNDISSTTIRDKLFSDDFNPDEFDGHISPYVKGFLISWKQENSSYEKLQIGL